MGILAYLRGFLTAHNICQKRMGVLCGVHDVPLFAVSLSASSITISASGEFVAGTLTSPFSAPDETWSFSFVVDTNPGVSNVNLGNYFDVDFSDFTYDLDGSPVAITPEDIRFFSTSQYGGFSICFTTACSFFNSPADGFSILGKQMYTQSESAPTMSVGAFTSTYLEVYVDSYEFLQQPPGHTTLLAELNPIPEPSTIPILCAGLLLATVGPRRRQRRI